MPVVIIVLDALEYSLAINYPILCQREYGKIRLDGFAEILTVPILTSFITGLMPEKHGLTSQHYIPPWLRIGSYLWRNTIGRIIVHRKIAKKMGLVNFPTKRNIKVPTIFDYAKRPIVISLPGYSEEFLTWPPEDPWGTYETKRKRIIDSLTCQDFDLFMAHINITDSMGHLHMGDAEYMKEFYGKISSMIQELKEIVERVHGEDSLFLIVSDHGMRLLGRRGVHTRYGFYSSNKPLNLHEPHITDFFDIIRLELGNIDDDILKDRLKAMGYF